MDEQILSSETVYISGSFVGEDDENTQMRVSFFHLKDEK